MSIPIQTPTDPERLGLFSDRENRGPSCHTYSGGRFYVLNPRAEDVDLDDLAHALSNQCRFNGHTKEFYSVAQHSVMVEEALYLNTLGLMTRMHGLLHDAAEAYMGDVTRPIKAVIESLAPGIIKGINDKIEAAILDRFDLPPIHNHKAIKHADNIVLATEARDVMSKVKVDRGSWGHDLPEPLHMEIYPEYPDVAKANFLSQFHYLWDLLGRSEDDI